MFRLSRSAIIRWVPDTQKGNKGREVSLYSGTNYNNIMTKKKRNNVRINPLNPELNPICYLLVLLGAHHFLHVSRIRVKLLTFR